MKMLFKIGQHPAHPCSRPPPIFSATSARPPLRGAGGLGARGARCRSADGGGIWDTRVPGGAAQGKSCHSTAGHHIGGRAVPSQDEHVYRALPHGLYYLIFPANARKQFTRRSLTKPTTARTPGAAAKLRPKAGRGGRQGRRGCVCPHPLASRMRRPRLWKKVDLGSRRRERGRPRGAPTGVRGVPRRWGRAPGGRDAARSGGSAGRGEPRGGARPHACPRPGGGRERSGAGGQRPAPGLRCGPRSPALFPGGGAERGEGDPQAHTCGPGEEERGPLDAVQPRLAPS